MADYLHSKTYKLHSVILSLSFSLLALIFGFLFFNMQKSRIVTEKRNDLNAIINLKVTDIVDWRREHLRDARILSENSGLNNLMRAILRREAPESSESTLRNILLKVTEEYDYHNIFLVDTNNIVRFSTASEKINEPYENQPKPKPDLQLSPDSSMIFMDISVGIKDERGMQLGTLVLRVDPEITLFPHIQTWPSQSRSSESLLCRSDGDSVLFLNELRHRKGTAMMLRLPASDPALPAAKAVNGFEGFFEGKDYRGVDVVSYLQKIPDSPWYMIAKVDKAEIYAPLKEQFFLVTIIVILTITTFSILIRLHFGNQRMRYLNEINKTRDKLYSIISHDLKNPFVSILGFSELLYERSLANDFSRTKEFAGIIYNSSANAVELLNNLTSWAKLQTGRVFFNPRETDLVALVHEVIGSCNPAAIMKNIKIRISSPGELTTMVDRVMFSTILRNLVLNAIKFSYNRSEVIVTLRKNDSLTEVEVEDSGTGMDSKMIEKILNNGKYDSMAGTANEKGTGLGLFLCMEFIAMHNGTLQIDSEPGKGSRFRVNFLEK